MLKLRNILSPPLVPVEKGDRNSWPSIEQTLGIGLPLDYKLYIETYGSGCLDGFIWVLNPFSSNPNLNLLHGRESALRALQVLREQKAYELPYPLFPETGGILPWGLTDNGDVLYWLTKGEPGEWTVVVNASREPRTEHYPYSMTEFLAKILGRQIVSAIFPDDFPDKVHSLVPAQQ
jgi:hypothetical protein